MFLPSDYLTVTYDPQTGVPSLANSVPAEPTEPSITDAQKARLVVTKDTTVVTYLFKNQEIDLPDSLFGSFPAFFSSIIDNAQTLQTDAKAIIDAYKAKLTSESGADMD